MLGIVAAALALAAPTATIDLGGHPGALALDHGQVWAAVYKSRERGLAVRVDPATNRVTARVRLRGSPFELESGAGALWATGNFSRRGDVLHRIDPRSGRVVTTLELPGRYAGPMATGRRSVWVGVRGRRAASFALVKVDAEANRVTESWRIPRLDRRYVDRIEVGRGAVWLLALRAGRTGEQPGQIIRVAPQTGRVEAAIGTRALTLGLGPGGLWFSGCSVCGVRRTHWFARAIDTQANAVAGPPIVRRPLGFAPLFVGRDRVWFSGYTRNEEPVAFSVDPRTGRTERFLRLGSDLYADMALDPGADRLWVGLATGSLLRVDLADG
jgi:hypothetical protein